MGLKRILLLMFIGTASVSKLGADVLSPCNVWDNTIKDVTSVVNSIDCAVYTLNTMGTCSGCTLVGIRKDAINLDPGVKITDLSGAQLRFTNFAGFDFGNAKLDGANLVGANLEGATFSGSLVGTNLSGATLDDAHFENAILGNTTAGASLYGASLKNAYFTGNQHIEKVGFGGADIAGADFSGAKIQNLVGELVDDVSHTKFGTEHTTDLAGSGVIYLDFRAVQNLNQAVFSADGNRNAGLPAVNLSGLTLTGLDLSGLDLTGADFTDSTLDGCNLSTSKLMGAKFDNAVLTGGTNLGTGGRSGTHQGASFKNVKFQKSVDQASDYSVIASWSDFSGAIFDGAAFEYADFWGSKFNGASLSGAIIAKSSLMSHTQFKEANLSNATLYGSFISSDFQNAVWTGTKLAFGIDLTNSTYNPKYFDFSACQLSRLFLLRLCRDYGNLAACRRYCEASKTAYKIQAGRCANGLNMNADRQDFRLSKPCLNFGRDLLGGKIDMGFGGDLGRYAPTMTGFSNISVEGTRGEWSTTHTHKDLGDWDLHVLTETKKLTNGDTLRDDMLVGASKVPGATPEECAIVEPQCL